MNDRDYQLFKKLPLTQEQVQENVDRCEKYCCCCGCCCNFCQCCTCIAGLDLSAIFLHTIPKLIIISMFYLKTFYILVLDPIIFYIIAALMVVIDFWLTKNVSGKRMIGLRWFFKVDEYGTDKFMFESAVDQSRYGRAYPNIFWGSLVIYTLIPSLFNLVGFIEIIALYIRMEMFMLSLGVMIAGGANIFFFIHASLGARERQKLLWHRLGGDVVQTLGYQSIVSYR